MSVQEVIRELAPEGMIRTSVNLGNPVLANRNKKTGEVEGISIDLAREIGRRLGVDIRFEIFDSAGKVFGAVSEGHLDLMFLALDPVRAKEILFTEAYILIEGNYLVRDNASFQAIDDLDHQNVRIAVGRGAAYDLFLTRYLKNAFLERAESSSEAIDLFVSDNLDAAAGVRQPLEAYMAVHPGYRVIDGSFTAIQQGIGTPKGREAAREWLQNFIEDAKSSGLVASLMERHHQTAAKVAPFLGHRPAF